MYLALTFEDHSGYLFASIYLNGVKSDDSLAEPTTSKFSMDSAFNYTFYVGYSVTLDASFRGYIY